MAALTGNEKRKVYWKIFYVLGALTIFELGIVFAPLPPLLITLLVVIASSSKAFFVGWYYMHLNHETKWLQMLTCLPLLIVFFYASFLMADAHLHKARHSSPYVGEPKRFFGQRIVEERELDEFGHSLKAATPPTKEPLAPEEEEDASP
jgi:hypothetical protein